MTEETQPKLMPMVVGNLNTLVIETPGIAFMYQIDIDAPNAKNDEIILQHNDSEWMETIKVSDLEEVEDDWVRLFFTNPPKSGTYNMLQDPKDAEEPFFVFSEIAYEDLTKLTPEVEEMALISEEEAPNENTELDSQETGDNSR